MSTYFDGIMLFCIEREGFYRDARKWGVGLIVYRTNGEWEPCFYVLCGKLQDSSRERCGILGFVCESPMGESIDNA